MRSQLILGLILLAGLLGACRPTVTEPVAGGPGPTPSSDPATSPPVRATTLPNADGDSAPTGRPDPPPSPTPFPTATPVPSPSVTATLAPTPSPTPLPACSERHPPDESLLTLVDREYGLSRTYKPGDLVPLSDHFSNGVTLGYPTEVREAIVDPLTAMIRAMEAEGLSPLLVSGFRDYYAQSLAAQKWVEQYPDWAHHLSAPPGHSEHQLGTTVDFSSPDLPEMVGEEHIQFHPAFAQSKEGEWLAAHAHEYGFTMSYPANRFEDTAFYYEPWHFRYVGVELATTLHERDLTISEYLLEQSGPPCIP